MPVPDINVMCDIETLGTKPGSIILSIALVPFRTNMILDNFYVKIDVNSSIKAEFHEPDPSTIKWWAQLPENVQTEAFSGGIDVKDAFAQLQDYIKNLPGTPVIWGNGCGFDNELIKWGLNHLNIEIPWSYKDDADYRTMCRLFKNKVAYIKPTMAHSALADAIAQAERCGLMFKLLDDMFSSYEEKITSCNVVKKLTISVYQD